MKKHFLLLSLIILSFGIFPVHAQLGGAPGVPQFGNGMEKLFGDNHPCVKNKAVVTDQQGEKHEFTVWNATDLKNFPVKIEMNEQGNAITMSYSDISFSKPDASLFTPPTGYTKYGSVQEMMQAVMMKNMGSGMGFPPQ